MASKAGANVSISPTGIISATNTIYSLPIATSGALGGVRVANGSGLNISQNGTITATIPFTNATTSSGGGIFQQVFDVGTQLNHPVFGKLFITTDNIQPLIANNTMTHHLEVNGSTRINWNLIATGNVGIGTATPQNRFTIRTEYFNENTGLMLDAGDGSAYNMKFFSYVIGSYLVGHRFKLQNVGTTHDNMLCFAPNGNVGIGISNPQSKLHILSANPQLLLDNGTGGAGVINFGNSAHGAGRFNENFRGIPWKIARNSMENSAEFHGNIFSAEIFHGIIFFRGIFPKNNARLEYDMLCRLLCWMIS